MHVALIIDDDRLQLEQNWVNRIVVGLISVGARVTRLLPEDQPGDQRVALTPVLQYRKNRIPWLDRPDRERLVKQLLAAKPDVLHAMGVGAWDVGLELARAIGCPLVLDIWSATDIAPAVKRTKSSSTVAALIAANESIGATLRDKVEPDLVNVIPIGVYLPESSRPILTNLNVQEAVKQDDAQSSEDTSPSLLGGVAAVVMGRGATLSAVQPLLSGFAAIATKYPELMLFADFNEQVSHQAWALAGKLGIRSRMSLIPSVLQHRSSVLGADLLLIPHNTLAANSMLLEALAVPMQVISVVNESIDLLTPHELDDTNNGILLLDSGKPKAWATTLTTVLADPHATHKRVMLSRAIIEKRHTTSRQAMMLYETYETILTGDAVKLEQN